MTLFRLPSVAAWLAGAALLAGSMAPPAQAQTEETAMAVPRLAPLGPDGVVLPRPLAAADAAVLRRLFARPGMDRATLHDLSSRLDPASQVTAGTLGHVLAERYLGQVTRPGAADIADWLARYPTLPDAPAIAALGGARPAQRQPAGLALAASSGAARDRRHPSAIAVRWAEQARTLFTRNRDDAALALASRAAAASGGQLGLADYVAGLAAWRSHRLDLAATHFAAAARAPVADAELLAAAGFWTARTCLERGQTEPYRAWVAFAGALPQTFYGQIARRLSGADVGPTEILGEAEVEAVAAEPGGLRAFALLQVGQAGRAEAELRQLATTRPVLRRAILLIARHARLPDLAGDLAVLVQRSGDFPAADRSFMPSLRPSNGFLVDPPLVYALTRVESNFDPAAVSAMGAQGLMQIMPATAGAVSVGRARRPRLHDPAVNLDLGQRYVAYLSAHAMVAGDLIRLLASYNSGPAAFARWSGSIAADGDPLLFIEAIPTLETRNFVQGTLAYTWRYAARLHLPAPSLDAIAAGAFPRAAVGRLH